MPPVSKRPIPEKTQRRIYEVFVNALGKARKKDDLVPFLSDLLTPTEQIMIAKRLSIALLLLRDDYDQRQIANTLKVSTSTVARVNLILKTQGDGFRKVLEKMLREQQLKILLNELYGMLTPVPPKGANWGRWKKEERERRERFTSF